MENNRRFFTIEKTVALMAIFLPVLYLIGYFYEAGYLSVYAVSTDFFPRSVADYLTWSFSAISACSVDIWLWVTSHWCDFFILFPFLAIYFFIGVVGAYVSRKSSLNRHGISTRFDKVKRTRGFWFIFFPFGMSVFTIGVFLILLVLMLAIIFSPYVFYKYGEGNAKREIKSFQACGLIDENKNESKLKSGSHMQECIYIYRDDTLVLSGILITADATHAAIWDGKKAVIMESSGKQFEIVRRVFPIPSQAASVTAR